MADFFNNLPSILMTAPSAMAGGPSSMMGAGGEDFSRFRGRPEEEEGGFNGEDFFATFGEDNGDELTLRLYDGGRLVSQVADHLTQLELYSVVAFLNLSALNGDRVLEGHRLTFQATGMPEVDFMEVVLVENDLNHYMNVAITPVYVISAEKIERHKRREEEQVKMAASFGSTYVPYPMHVPKGKILNSKMELGTITGPLVWIHDIPIKDAPGAMMIETRDGDTFDEYWSNTDVETIFTFNNAEDAKRMLHGIILVEKLLEPVGVKPGDLFRTHNLKLPHYIAAGMDGDDGPGPLMRLELDEFEFEGLAGFIEAFNLNSRNSNQYFDVMHLEPAKALYIHEDVDEIRRMFNEQFDFMNPGGKREFEHNSWIKPTLERGHIFEKPSPGAYLIRQLYGNANGRLYIPPYAIERYLKGAKMGHKLFRDRINVNVSDIFPLGGPDGNRLLYH